MNKFYVEMICGFDEFTVGAFDTKEEAIEEARHEWARMCEADRNNNRIEVRQYEEDIEDEGCNNFDYNKFEWENHTFEVEK